MKMKLRCPLSYIKPVNKLWQGRYPLSIWKGKVGGIRVKVVVWRQPHWVITNKDSSIFWLAFVHPSSLSIVYYIRRQTHNSIRRQFPVSSKVQGQHFVYWAWEIWKIWTYFSSAVVLLMFSVNISISFVPGKSLINNRPYILCKIHKFNLKLLQCFTFEYMEQWEITKDKYGLFPVLTALSKFSILFFPKN